MTKYPLKRLKRPCAICGKMFTPSSRTNLQCVSCRTKRCEEARQRGLKTRRAGKSFVSLRRRIYGN